ncbi:MAG: fimbria major subunit [Tannerellaceae bacterium]|nr:fimbria major subunit [Tannerellaceae bacterium]
MWNDVLPGTHRRYDRKTPSLRYAAIRNHYYALTVKSISALGRAYWDKDIPEVELTTDADIEFDIEVKEWQPVNIEVAF